MANMTAVVAALAGSLAGGVGHYLLARRSSRATRRAMLTGLVAEVDVLRHLLDLQFGTGGSVAIFPIVYHGELAAVYDGLSAKLGSLDDHDAVRIVRFHTLCKTIIGMAEKQGADAVARSLVAEALAIGEGIVADHRR